MEIVDIFVDLNCISYFQPQQEIQTSRICVTLRYAAISITVTFKSARALATEIAIDNSS